MSMTLGVSYTVLTSCYLLILYPGAIMSGCPSVLYARAHKNGRLE